MILPVSSEEAVLILEGGKRSKIIADPKNRWKAGSLIHFYTGWPIAGGVPLVGEEDGLRLVRSCKFARYVEIILRDNHAHVYLSKEGPGGPPSDVLRHDSDGMLNLARSEVASGVEEFLNRYFFGWKYADPDDWKFWEGKIIFW